MLQHLISLDQKLFIFLNGLHVEWLNSFMTVISGQIVWIPLLGFSFYSAYKSFSKKQLVLFLLFLGLLLVITDTTSSYILKNLTERLRPCKEVDLKPLIYQFGQKCGGRFSFVSSHASNSLALILFFCKTIPFPRYVKCLLLILPFIIGYSRIYLGVHYPGDVLAGFLVGALWTYFFSYCWDQLKEQDG